METFEIHPDIRYAETLPSHFYTGDGVFEALLDRVFGRSWQWVGKTEDLVPGTDRVAPVTLFPGTLDEPMLLVRDAAGAVRCLSNVCTHRGNLLVEAPGRCRQLVCGYHGRRFTLEGRFAAMPEFEQAEGFPRPCDDLLRFPWQEWGGHGFTGIDPAFALDGVLDAMSARVGFLPLAEFRHDPSRDRTFEIRAHWALYCDNYLEGFHIPFVHADLHAAVDYDRYRTILFDHCSLQVAEARDGHEAFTLPEGHMDRGRDIAAYYFWVFPNMMFNFYPWGLSVNVVEPMAKDRTRVHFRSYVLDPTLIGMGAGGDLDKVEQEDEAIVEQVQRGIRSRGYSTGRYSPTREQGVHHFHRLLAAALG